jgi:hypothetical protein
MRPQQRTERRHTMRQEPPHADSLPAKQSQMALASESQKSRCRLAQRIPAAHLVRGMKKVMMVVPVDAEVYKA